MRKNAEYIRRRLAKTPGLYVLPVFFLFMLAVLIPGSLGFNLVTVTDAGGQNFVLMTNSESPEEILMETGFESVYYQGESYPAQQAVPLARTVGLSVRNRVYQVQVNCDGTVIEQTAVTGTVADILHQSGIELGEQDYVEPAADTPIEDDTEVTVYRVSYVEETIRTDVSDERVDEYVARLAQNDPGASFTRSKSKVYDVSYRHTLVNGEIAESLVMDLAPVVTPNDPANTEFVDGVACSSIDRFEGVEFDENGLPTNYSRKISGAVTTAYSSSGGRGSSGMGLYCGTVAVDPKKIPYGSKLYIVSPKGNFVYGFAIASDTGIALVDGRVDIDLYFESNAECYKFGKRAMDVYIFD